MDAWLRCWYCGTRLDTRLIPRDGILRSRAHRDGGPFFSYDCPQCGQENLCERTRRGRFFASPPQKVSLLDYLLGRLWSGAPESFLRMLSWYRENEERRRYAFERDGDFRYSGLRARLRRAAAGLGPERGPRPEPEAEPEPPRVRPHVASPYEILGVEPGATQEEIKRAFHALVRREHPDKVRHLGPAFEARATRRFKALLEAYERLNRTRGTRP